MKRIAQRLTRIKQRFGAPFNVARVDVIESVDDWKPTPRSVALKKEDGGEVTVRFAGDGRTRERFIELAKGVLADHEVLDGIDEIALVVIPRDLTPKEPPQQ